MERARRPNPLPRRLVTTPSAIAALAAMLALSGCALAPRSGGDGQPTRIEAVALLQTLNADLLSHDSATSTLEQWCAGHHLADPARVVALRAAVPAKPIPDELRLRLAVAADERIGYRRVRLACGEHVLSEADNWYVPARLTEQMNRALETTDEPFGKVVRPLGFERHTLAAETLWLALPRGWELPHAQPLPRSPLRIPPAVLRHTAVLRDAHARPFSVVVETYTSELFAFGDWARLRGP